MKKLLTILAVVILAVQTGAQSTEYLQQKDFKVEKQKIYEGINASRKQLNEVKKGDLKLMQSFDSLKRTLDSYKGQLGMAIDSLLKTSTKLNALQEKVDNEKFLSKGLRIMMILLLHLSVIFLFILVFLFRKKAALNFQTLTELEKKTNERIDIEIKNLLAEIQNCKDLIGKTANDINQRILTGLNSLETRNSQVEKQLQESLSGIEDRLGSIGTEISKFREEQSKAVKTAEDKLNTLKQDMEQRYQGFTSQAAKLEEEIKSLKGKH